MSGKFNTQEFLGRALSYVKYARLVAILVITGFMAGVVYYVFSDALYYSQGLINIRMFDYGVDPEDGDVKQSVTKAKRGVSTQLKSNHMIKKVAIHMGLADESVSSGVIREKMLPKVELRFEDNNHLQLAVYSTSPEIVRPSRTPSSKPIRRTSWRRVRHIVSRRWKSTWWS